MRPRRILSIVGRQIFRLAGAAVIMSIFGSAAPAGAENADLRPDPLATLVRKGLGKPPAKTNTDAAIVTEDGPVKGFPGFVDGTEVFFAIPYAAPPVGNLRWMPPQPHGKWTGVLKNTYFGDFCTQPDGSGGTFGSEDCLTLNVFTPSGNKNQNKKSPLPVMVWIHGGGLVTGGSLIYEPSPLVLRGNLIVVTINYRLGYLGFFAHHAIDGEGHLNGNYGLMDQQFALQWVKRNIAAFGGDPNRVTIFGESAGAQSVYSNLASLTAAGLFQGAIAESGAYFEFQDYFDNIVPLAQGETSGDAIAAAVGCSSQTADCLRSVPASTLALQEPGIVYPFIDGTVFTQSPSDSFASGTSIRCR